MVGETKLETAQRLMAEVRAKQLTEGEPRFQVLSMSELCALADEPRLFEFDAELGVYRIYWGGYDYKVDYETLKEPIDLLHWIVHLGGKGWELTTDWRIADWVESVCRRRGWDVHGRTVIAPRTNSDGEERAKLTRDLRWKVLKRDGFACRACGANAATGAVLHVDHVTAIARGGRTVFDNLQTLCSGCNLGKGASQ